MLTITKIVFILINIIITIKVLVIISAICIKENNSKSLVFA